MNIPGPVTKNNHKKILDSFPSNPVSYFNLFPASGMARIK